MTSAKKTQLFSKSFVQSKRTNEQLMQEFMGGKEEAFAMLYENFKGPIYSFIFGMLKDEQVASELAQDVFIKVYKAKDSFDPSKRFTTWLWSIARNTSIDHLRKKDPLRYPIYEKDEAGETANPVENIASDLEEQSELLVKKAQKEAIEKCLKELKSSQEEVLRLRILSELNYEDIQKVMDISLSAVKSLLNRAKNNIVKCLKGCLHE